MASNARKYAADTIVATATPPGIGGVAIVRISGPDVERIGRSMLGLLPNPRSASWHIFRDSRHRPIDSGLALYFPAPASYTGESILELQGHGGPRLPALLVEAAIELGARQAQPGEFTQRAFLNDKLDLAQAEAVADLVASGTEQAARAALRSLSGEFSSAVNALSEKLVQLRMYVEAAIDFPEEEIDFLADDTLSDRLEDCEASMQELLRTTRIGRVLRDGYNVVIVGKANAGKSSLLNRLSGEDTAIVTEIAGTTRDILRERIDIDGLAVDLVDTAGLREDPDRIEAEGIRRARTAMQKADAVLWVQDAVDADPGEPDAELPAGIPVLVVRNKIDLSGEDPGSEGKVLRISAKTGAGVNALRANLKDLAGYEDLGEGAFTARRRHLQAIHKAADHFTAGRKALVEARAGELLAEELRMAQESLGEITGAVSADDLLGRIFSEFCIGK